MKRALAVLLACCGFAAFAQFPAFTGKWEARVCYAPVSLSSTLSLTTNIVGFDITGAFTFIETGLDNVTFSYKGGFGPFSLKGNLWFDDASPFYLASDLSSSFEFGGLGFGLVVRHWLPNKYRAEWSPDTNPCTAVQTGMEYIITATVDPISLKLYLADCCEGIEFNKGLITIKNIGLCCGIALTADVAFNKDSGFQTLTLKGLNIPICCGVSIDVTITYGVSSKSITLAPKLGTLVSGCYTVWAGPVSAGTPSGQIWDGIRVDGFRVRCTIGDCNYIDYVHVFNFETGTQVPKAIRDKFNRATGCRENEYLELGFCGAGCCGGKYEVMLRMLWSTEVTTPRLFGLTRFVGSAKIPVMANFTINLDFTMPILAACGSPSFCAGWTFTF